MKKKISMLLFTVLFCISGCSAQNADNIRELGEADSAYRFKQIYMCDEQTGWALTTENEILFTADGIEKFSVVRKIEETDPGTDGFASAAFVSETTGYLAYFSPENAYLAVEYTSDGGASWQETLLDYGSFGDACDAGSAYMSFVDERTGYLLYCSTPAAGSMKKILLGTADGGESFSVIADLSDQIAGYPQGISFGAQKGYIAVSYHGEDAYLYASSDGGRTWEEEEIYRAEESVNYIDGYPPAFCGSDRKKGMLVLKTVGEDTAYQMYVTADGGDRWEAAGRLACEYVGGYACVGENDFFILDNTGKLYENKK